MTWMIPLDAWTLALIKFARLILTWLPIGVTDTAPPFNMCSLIGRRIDKIQAAGRRWLPTTWYWRRLISWCLFSGLSKLLRTPGGSLAKAASVGANSVNGPRPFNVPTRPAAWRAAARVLNWPLLIAVWTISALYAEARKSGYTYLMYSGWKLGWKVTRSSF